MKFLLLSLCSVRIYWTFIKFFWKFIFGLSLILPMGNGFELLWRGGSWSTFLTIDHGVNSRVSWSWSVPYPPPKFKRTSSNIRDNYALIRWCKVTVTKNTRALWRHTTMCLEIPASVTKKYCTPTTTATQVRAVSKRILKFGNDHTYLQRTFGKSISFKF